MFWIETHFAVVLIISLTVIAGALILQQRRSPQSTLAWLFFIITVPYVAIPVFLALGFRKQQSWFPTLALPKSGACKTSSGLDAAFCSFGLPAAQDGHRFELQTTGEASFAALMSLISEARHSIDAMFYIVADDAVGKGFINALTEKARSGVTVRLILDSFGSLRRPRAELRAFQEAGGRVQFFSPLLRMRRNGRLNLRNHRKMVIIDRKQVFAGGMNIGEEYLGPTIKSDQWRDLSYVLQGPAIEIFDRIFSADWDVLGKTEPAPFTTVPPCGDAVAQLVPSGPDIRNDALHDGLVYGIHAAQKRVWIVTPYFLPTELLENALTTAARRGVDVRLIVPVRSNQRIADFARGPYLREMAKAGCRVLRFEPGMIHAKAVILDDAAFVGSANFDVRSMLLNFETALFMYDRPSVDTIARWFVAQEACCRSGLNAAGTVRRVAEGIFRLGAPIL